MKVVCSSPSSAKLCIHTHILQFLRSKSLVKLTWLLLIPLLISLSGCDTEPDKKEKIVVGIINPNPALDNIVDGFKEKLTQLCALDNRVITYLHPKPLKIKDINNAVNAMKTRNVDMVFTVTSPATRKAKEALKETDTPIVFAPIYDPVRAGIVEKLHGNYENLTGIKIGGSNAKALEWLIASRPNIKNILVPFSGKSSVEKLSLSDLQDAAEKLEIELRAIKVNTLGELESTLKHIDKDINALWLLHSIFLAPRSDQFVRAAIKHKIPLASGTGLADTGVMLAYGQHYRSTGMQAARLAHQIVRGTSPNDLPIETADFFLNVNLITATAAEVEIPKEILLQAENIIRPE